MNLYLLIRDIDFLFQFQALLAVLEPDCSEVVLLSVIPNENKAIEMEKPVGFMLFLPKTASSKWLKHSSFCVILGVKVKLPTVSWLWGHSWAIWWMLSTFYLFYSLVKKQINIEVQVETAVKHWSNFSLILLGFFLFFIDRRNNMHLGQGHIYL